MNFVIFSYSFPPRCGAETFCSARFASALACAGHSVSVVTMDHPCAVAKDVYEALVDPALKITRIPVRCHDGFNNVVQRLRHRMRGREAVDFRCCVQVLRRVLSETETPILISRSMPEISNMVAWHCRKSAVKWIAHFSDPFPWGMGHGKTLIDRLFSSWGYTWGRRIIHDADAISLTCDSAKRWFHDVYGQVFDKKEVLITPHIGEPPLRTSKVWKRDCDGHLIVHAGGLGKTRGVCQVLDAIRCLNKMGEKFSFYQVGDVDVDVQSYFEETVSARIIKDTSPDTAMAVASVADVCFIPDMRTHLPYSPFLPSKFVYQLFTDVPIVIYTFKDSAMAEYARRFPNAGIVLADVDKTDSLVKAFLTAVNIKRETMCRDGIRQLFTREAIRNIYTTGKI